MTLGLGYTMSSLLLPCDILPSISNRSKPIQASSDLPPPAAAVEGTKVAMQGDVAATKIQGLVRQKEAKQEARTLAKDKYREKLDPIEQQYYYENKRTGSRHSQQPLFTDRIEKSTIATVGIIRLQAYTRRMLARKIVLQRKREVFSRHYDPESGLTFYMDRRTGLTTWDKPRGLGKDEVDYTSEDLQLLIKDQEIQKLKEALDAKDKELVTLTMKRTEEVEVMLRKHRVEKARLEGADKRTQDMDLWTMEEVIAWFVEEGMPEYEAVIVKQRVDGFLLVHLDNHDWDDLGIKNKVHQKRLALLLAPYRQRWEARKAAGIKAENSDSQSLTNTVSVNELMSRNGSSDLQETTTEENEEEEEGDGELEVNGSHEENDEEDGSGQYEGEEEEDEDEEDKSMDPAMVSDAEEKKRLDAENMSIEILHQGSSKLPAVGDVVQVHYSCYLVDKGKLVESSRNNRGRPFEFALGLGLVITGWDRCLLKVGLGSRVKVTLRPAYAYGKTGLPPLIPPHASLLFDIEIISFRKRPNWSKPVIQSPGLSEQLYWSRPEDESDYEKYIKSLKGRLADTEVSLPSIQGADSHSVGSSNDGSKNQQQDAGTARRPERNLANTSALALAR